MRVLVLLDGTVADPDQPHIRVDDLGVTRGDGVFETLLVDHGQPRELDAHLRRLARSAARLDLPEPDETAWRHVVATAIEHWTEPECALKLVYTRGVDGTDTPTGYALGTSIGERIHRQRRDGVGAVLLDRGVDEGLAERAPWLLLGAKTLSYAVNMAAVREAERRGADEVIFTTNQNTVFEGPTSSVVVANGDTLRTPPPRLGILEGTTQGALFRAADRAGWRCAVDSIAVDELFTADWVGVVSSVRKVTRVHTLDGKRLPESGQLHERLCALYESAYA